ncbi:branched-chain amino acid transport system II carrier protein, partial [Bacillus sp. JJ1474]
VLFTGVFALMGGLTTFGLDLGSLESVRAILPFYSVGLEWIVPAIAGAVIGILLSGFDRKVETAKAVEIKG